MAEAGSDREGFAAALARNVLPATRRAYVNSHQITMTVNDAQLIFYFNGMPEQVLVMSLGMAKDLATDLTAAISTFERDVIRVTINSSSALAASMAKAPKSGGTQQ